MFFCRIHPKLADYLDLVAAVEDTCAHLKRPVWLEGYTPPSDPRLKSFSVTPDPGVIEVNLRPPPNWEELEKINQTVFAEAEANKLTAQKFAHRWQAHRHRRRQSYRYWRSDRRR